MKKIFISGLGLLLLALGPTCSRPKTVEIRLEAQIAQEGRGPRWSPKGEKLTLREKDLGLETRLQLGGRPANAWAVRMVKRDGSEYYNALYLDRNRNDVFEEAERIDTRPSETRGKIWSSFAGEVQLEVTDPWSGETAGNVYPLNLWYVEDPLAEAPEQVLRFSRGGWMEGRARIDGMEALILLAESVMDGVFDAQDSWTLAPAADPKELYDYRNARSLDQHAWLNDKAYRIVEAHPSGRRVVIEPFDPGLTREEEALKTDLFAPDKNEDHSGGRVSFGRDFAEAERAAREAGKNLFLDFETVWCGPCKIMDEIVYNADLVVEASKDIVAVKVDGDEHRDLVKRFEISGYPTLILLSPDGRVLGKAVGYQSVKDTAAFLRLK